ncbi:ribonuclease H-like protein [Wilcoxina mikolae CBS 423.85]|nr:ribonuclease H-like protein [Wilcoxina mikolae CBS 423.85]
MSFSKLSSLPLPPKSSYRPPLFLTARVGPSIPATAADANRRFIPPSSFSTPIELFDVRINSCSCPDYRFISRTNPSQMLMFIDGASSGNGTPDAKAGCGVVITPFLRGRGISQRLELDGNPQTNNRAELRAAVLGLGLRMWSGEGFSSVVVATDSEYVVNGACDWIKKWRSNGWVTSLGGKVVNQDLWKMLEEKMRELEVYGTQVMFWKIPREWNEADALAKAATKLETAATKLTPLHIVGGYGSIEGSDVVIGGASFTRAQEAGGKVPVKFHVY